jgi:LAO/AO transport system kinase
MHPGRPLCRDQHRDERHERHRFRSHPAVQAALPAVTEEVRAGRLAASIRARRLLDLLD